MKKTFYDLFRIPYYQALITKDREVIGGAVVKMSKTNPKYFRLKKYKAVFLLPSKQKKELPVKIKSGYLLIYDIRKLFPLKMVSSDEANEYYERVEEKAVKPEEFIDDDLNPDELHDFLEAKVTEDIMADNKKEIPLWLIYLISIAVIAVITLGGLYLITKGGGTTIIYNATQTPMPTPTPGYVVIP